MNKYLFFAAMSGAAVMSGFFITGCVDYAYGHRLTFHNNSTHVITLSECDNLDDIFDNGDTYVLNPGESVSHQISDMQSGHIGIDLSIPLKITVTFDGEFIVKHDFKSKETIPNCICDEKNYHLTESTKYFEYYTYTFTDADYEYAESQ